MNNMFENASDLKALDLSGFDMASCSSTGNMFLNTSSLQSLKAPIHVQEGQEVTLAGTFTGADGTEYTMLPTAQEGSIPLTRK
jgi:surface protein